MVGGAFAEVAFCGRPGSQGEGLECVASERILGFLSALDGTLEVGQRATPLGSYAQGL